MLDEYNGIYYGEKRTVTLTWIQTKVLEILINDKNKVVRPATIIREIWGKTADKRKATHLIQIHVKNLNKLLEGEVEIIQKNGIGWIIKT
jgi:DNA-binding response OmpR family regulator